MNNTTETTKNNAGFTLVEVLVSLAIFVVGIMGVTKSVQTIIKTGYQTKLMETIASVSSNFLEDLSYDAVLNDFNIDESNQTVVNQNNVAVTIVMTRIASATPNSVAVNVVSSASGMGLNVSRPFTYALVRNLH
jgi:prepilin-type N-terminal cleavage/methylation domain-containing protein